MVEIIPKKEERAASWQRIIFYSLVVVLVGLIGFYFFLFFEHRGLVERGQEIDKRLEEIQQPEMKELEGELIAYKQKIEEVTPLIQEHKVGSKSLGFIEEHTHPEVFFTSINIDPLESQVVLRGTTDGFPSLGQQLAILKNDGKVETVGLYNVGVNKLGGVGFSLNLTLDKELFRY